MPGPFRLTVVNAAWDPLDHEPDALLDRFVTLTGWCEALRAADVPVTVVQRFSRDATVRRHHVTYHFVADGGTPRLAATASSPAVAQAVRAISPDVVHLNGLAFPALVAGLRHVLGRAPLLVVQDHAGSVPPRGRGWFDTWRRRRWANGLASADALSFTAAAQAAPWRDAGMLAGQRILAIVESSTDVRATPRDEARATTGISGDPVVLSVGRLTPGKDPMTVLSGFERFASRRPEARLVIVTPGGPLYSQVRARIEASPVLLPTVRILGAVAHRDIGHLYGAADLFVSGSHHEGSGYALIEALACGVTPVVTTIPSFEAIADGCGTRFAPGDSSACAEVLERACSRDAETRRAEALARFESALTWPAIATKTVRAYEALRADHSRA